MSDADQPAAVSSADNSAEVSSADDSDADVPEQFRIRQAKRERLLAEGRTPIRSRCPAPIRWPRSGPPTRTCPPTPTTGDIVGVTGRVVFARNSGKLCFATLQEGDGTQLQAMISLAGVGRGSPRRLEGRRRPRRHRLRPRRGDQLAARRTLGARRLLADGLARRLRPLPVAHKEMSEESRVRQRYVDLIVRPQARTVARQRIAVVRAVRSHWSGAASSRSRRRCCRRWPAGRRPGRSSPTPMRSTPTSILRIAPELFLKRCVVGGLEKVFELNRMFRNEGADSTHSPEFAMLETYQAYGTYDDSAIVTRELIQEVADEASAPVRCHCPTARSTISTANGRRFKCIRRCRKPSVKRSPRTLRWNTCWLSPTDSTSRFPVIAVTGTANSSRNCGSTPSATLCGRRRSSGISRSRPPR